MTDLNTALTQILLDRVGAAGVAGVALLRGPGAQPEVAGVPAASRPEPAFLVYSITKTFTAVLVLLLEEEGRLSLEDPLSRWFPRIDRAERIPLRRLLNHTAGIPDYGALGSYHDAVRDTPSTPWSFERFAAETFEKGLWFEPGTGWAYSNPGYMLLKRIAEEVTGTAYASLIAGRIAQPLELRRTFVPESVADLAALAPASSHALAPGGTDVRERYHPGWVSHGVAASTPFEIARFFEALFHGRLLSADSLREMTTLVSIPVDPAPRPAAAPPDRWWRPGYGLGLMGDPEAPWGVVYGHSGGGPGYRASVFHAPGLGGVTACAMGALEDFDAEQLVFEALDLASRRARD